MGLTADHSDVDLTTRKGDIELFLRTQTGAKTASVLAMERLWGGAIQENWKLQVELVGGAQAGHQTYVLRTDSPSGVAVSHSRVQEFKLLQAAHDAGVCVPEPCFVCDDTSVIGKSFAVMRWIPGMALGHEIVKDGGPGGDKARLAERLGQELAKIHSIEPPRDDLAFLGPSDGSPAERAIADYRQHLDDLKALRPAIEWGLRWCEVHLPPATEIVLVHQDFRTGNYLVDEDGLTAILDWEFCAWGDPMSDIGWFCAKYWRFGRDDREAGGVASRGDFYRGYEQTSGRVIDPVQVLFWEVMANIRWAVIALQQAERFLTGGEASLDLALTGRVLPQVEQEILRLTPPQSWGGGHD